MTDHLDDVINPGDDVAYRLLGHTTWLTRDNPGDPLRLVDVDDMTPTHQRNLLAWLRGHAAELHYYARKAVQTEYQRGRLDPVEMATAMTLIGAVADLWLEGTVLYRRLSLLVHGRSERRRRFLPARLRGTR